MDIITGMTGKPHVTAAQHRKIIRAITGDESYLETYVADFGEKMEMVLSNNKVLIKSGLLIHHGCVGEIPEGTYDEISLEPGELGKYRTDALVAKYEKDPVTGIEKFDWDIVKGEARETYPSIQPGIEENDLVTGSLVDMQLAAWIYYDGLNPTLERVLMTREEICGDVNKEIRENMKKEIMSSTHPIGSIYMTIDSESDPARMFGGQWERWGNGRVPVGVDETQAEFFIPNGIGGEKEHILSLNETPAHCHNVRVTEAEVLNDVEGIAASKLSSELVINQIGNKNTISSDEDYMTWQTEDEGPEGERKTTKAHNNLQPYITCYMWLRTA